MSAWWPCVGSSLLSIAANLGLEPGKQVRQALSHRLFSGAKHLTCNHAFWSTLQTPALFEMGGPAVLHRYYYKEKTWVHSRIQSVITTTQICIFVSILCLLLFLFPPPSPLCEMGREVGLQVSPGINWARTESRKRKRKIEDHLKSKRQNSKLSL